MLRKGSHPQMAELFSYFWLVNYDNSASHIAVWCYMRLYVQKKNTHNIHINYKLIMHTIIHGTLCYWPLCSRLGRCPCSLSALRGEMPWKHIRQPFQLPCTDEGDLTWDLGAWNKTLEGRQLNCVVQQPFHIFKGRKAKSASHFTPRMAWGWSVPPSAIPGSSDGHEIGRASCRERV